MGRRKPRKSPRRVLPTAEPGRFLVEDVHHAGAWVHRNQLVEYERINGMEGVWSAALDEVFNLDWLTQQVDVQHAVAKCMLGPPYATYTRDLANVADLICAAKQGGPGATSLLRRLQVHEEFRGACAEARVVNRGAIFDGSVSTLRDGVCTLG